MRTQRFEKTLAEFGISDAELSEKIGNEYLQNTPLKTILIEGTKEILQKLYPHYPLYIVSNGFDQTQDVKLTTSNLKHFFKEIITSERAGSKKPNAAFFNFVLTVTGAKRENSLLIGDNLEADIQGAKDAGIDQVFFNPNNKITPFSPTFTINKLVELEDILL